MSENIPTAAESAKLMRKLQRSPALLDALGLLCMDQQHDAKRALLRRLEKLGLASEVERNVYGKGSAPIDRIPVTIKVFEPTGLWVTELWARSC